MRRRHRLGSWVALLQGVALACLLAACGGGTSGTGSTNPVAAGAIWFVESPSGCSSSVLRRLPVGGTTPVSYHGATGPDRITAPAIDPAGGKVYFTFGGSGGNADDRAQRVKIDGSGLETLATYTGGLSPVALGLDLAAGHVYWLLQGSCTPCPGCGACSKVVRSNLDGTTEVDIITFTGSRTPVDILIDPTTDSLFWCDASYALHLQRTSLVGVGTDLTYAFAPGEVGGVDALAIDRGPGKHYWLETNGSGIPSPARIRRSNLDGSLVETVVAVGGTQATTARGLALDPAGGMLYWTESDFCGSPASGRIRSARLDGSDVRTDLDGLGVLSGITFVP